MIPIIMYHWHSSGTLAGVPAQALRHSKIRKARFSTPLTPLLCHLPALMDSGRPTRVQPRCVSPSALRMWREVAAVVAVVTMAAMAAVAPCAQEARSGSQPSSICWATCFYPCWCLVSYVYYHEPRDHFTSGNSRRGHYARSRIPGGQTLGAAGVSRPHTRTG